MIKFKRTILLTLVSMGLIVANAAIAGLNTEKGATEKNKQVHMV